MGHATARLTIVLIARIPRDGIASFQAYEEAVLALLSEFGGSLERRLPCNPIARPFSFRTESELKFKV